MIGSKITTMQSNMGTSAVARIAELCCFNSASDPFNGQTPNSISKPPKVIESRTLKSQSGDLLIETTLFYTAGQV